MEASGLWDAVIAELSDWHELRAVGCLILSLEALAVTWWWPRLFPPPRRPGGEGRRRRHRRDRRSSQGGGAWAGDSFSTGGSRRRSSVASSSRFSEDSECWESEGGGAGGGWSEAGRSSAPSSVLSFGGRSSRTKQSVLHAGSRPTSSSNAGRLESLSEQPKVAAAGQTPPTLPRKACVRYARPLLLMLLTLSASYLTTCLVLSTARPRPPGSTHAGAVEEESTSGAVDPRRKKREHDRAKALEEVERLRLARAEETRQAAEAAAGAAAAAAKARQEREETEKRREQAAAAEKKEKKEAEEARAEAKKRQREEAERARCEQDERKAAEVRKAEEERLEKRKQKAREEQKARDEAAGTKAKAKAKADAEAAQRREREALARAEAEATRRKSAKKASTLEQTESLGLERVLSNGSTMLRVMPNGDLVLSDHGEPVWTALGSKKRRVHASSLPGWIWTKIRRKPAGPCTECLLTVSPFGRVELRERNKVLWSDGQRKKGRRKKQLSASQQQAAADGDGVNSTFRLVVTGDGNAVVEREGAEVVWKALDR